VLKPAAEQPGTHGNCHEHPIARAGKQAGEERELTTNLTNRTNLMDRPIRSIRQIRGSLLFASGQTTRLDFAHLLCIVKYAHVMAVPARA
jgi:hypothetical protein